MSRPRPSDQHAPGHLRPTEAARHHPLPGRRQPACDISEMGERRLSSQGREGQSALSLHSLVSRLGAFTVTEACVEYEFQIYTF